MPEASSRDASSQADVSLIEVRVADLKHLFHAIDPSPVHIRDLDPDMQDYILAQARDLGRDASLSLLVHIDNTPAPASEQALKTAVQQFFEAKAAASRRRLREIFRRGRISLAIGVTFLAVALVGSELVRQMVPHGSLFLLFRESLLIGGWVALWRPMEIFLYDWWPIRAEARLFDRLAAMPVRLQQTSATHTGA